MSRRSLTLAAVVGLMAATAGAAAVHPDAEPARAERRPVAQIRQEPGDAMLVQRMAGDSVVDAHSYERARDRFRQLRTDNAGRAETAGVTWRSEGPTGIGGRLKDIASDGKGTLWVAAASGGVWRSGDGGKTFQRSWPDSFPQAIGALTRGPDGVLWAGTGETSPGGGSTTYAGTGLYRSADGGKTWKQSGLTDSHRIAEILVDPKNARRMYVAASGDLFAPGGQRGVYRSENGGRSWRKVLAGATPTAGPADLAIDPKQPRTLYATFWDHQRRPDLRQYAGPGSRAYKSTDGGTTWRELGGGLPAAGPDTGRLAITVAPSDPNRLYLLRVHRLGNFDGLWTSADAGATWTRLPDDPLLRSSQSSYGWWFGKLWVSPGDPSDLWVAGVPLIRSRDGGRTFGYGAADVHADQHAMLWENGTPGTIYLGNDGGFYRTDDDGATWVKAVSEPYTQYYTLDVGEQDPSRMVGGAQDNGCSRSYGSAEGWHVFGCGDGLETLINPVDQNRVYYCSQYGNCSRSADGGNTGRNFTGATTSTRRNWKAPLEFDPNDPSIMYYGGNILNRSADGGVTWTPISPDLTEGEGPDPQYSFGTLTTVAVAKSDPKRIYIGADDGTVAVTRDGGAGWTKINAGLPDRWVTRLRVDPSDADVVYVTLSGFRSGSDAAHVFRSTDGGSTWKNISGTLPNAPVNDIVQVGRTLYVANDVGVFVSPLGGSHWLPLPGLPETPVMELRVHRPGGRLYAASFGRGMYSTRIPVR
ncbi:WD40/YVTN/BNR-like repeat-containing protein [Actinomadura alba]|uniref:Glycosyl hydrolase n=1 Tax=Actinomadura alba TaxID=406431 RepID=A0ABR7LUY1_9ACTN|nr:sialidase family protein [Actinomadura alba]MBC6468223.1 glycosyl hydrolase [Actinomadura alba]